MIPPPRTLVATNFFACMSIADVLAAIGLRHLDSSLASVQLPELLALSRPVLLSKLKELGVCKLIERQSLASAVGKVARGAELKPASPQSRAPTSPMYGVGGAHDGQPNDSVGVDVSFAAAVDWPRAWQSPQQAPAPESGQPDTLELSAEAIAMFDAGADPLGAVLGQMNSRPDASAAAVSRSAEWHDGLSAATDPLSALSSRETAVSPFSLRAPAAGAGAADTDAPADAELVALLARLELSEHCAALSALGVAGLRARLCEGGNRALDATLRHEGGMKSMGHRLKLTAALMGLLGDAHADAPRVSREVGGVGTRRGQ